MYSLKNAKNFTPHPVSIVMPGSREAFVFPSMGNCRATSRQRRAHAYDWETGNVVEAPGEVATTEIEVLYPPEFTGVEFAPTEPPQGETVIVSIVAAPVLAKSRPDLTVYVPDTGPESAVRDEEGRIRGVRRMLLWHTPTFEDGEIRIVEPLNPANPGDGWTLLGSYPRTEEGILAAALEAQRLMRDGARHDLMLDRSDDQPIFIPADMASEDMECWARDVLCGLQNPRSS